MAKNANYSVRLSIDADGKPAVREINAVTESVEDLDTATEGVDTSRLTSDLLKLGAGYLTFQGIKELATSLGEVAVQGERMSSAFQAVTGSSDEAAAEIAYVGQGASDLGIDLDAATESWLSMSAAAKGTSLEGAEARRIFEAVAGSMAKLGKSSDATKGALLAIEQMISKGVVSAEELRGQLGERLPGAFQIAAGAMGVTTQELGEMLQAGDVVAEDLLPKLASALTEFYGSQPADSLIANWNRLTNEIKSTVRELNTATGATDSLGAGFAWLAEQWGQARQAISERSGIDGAFGQFEDDVQRVGAAIVRTREQIQYLNDNIGTIGTGYKSTELYAQRIEELTQKLQSLSREREQYIQLAVEDREIDRDAARVKAAMAAETKRASEEEKKAKEALKQSSAARKEASDAERQLAESRRETLRLLTPMLQAEKALAQAQQSAQGASANWADASTAASKAASALNAGDVTQAVGEIERGFEILQRAVQAGDTSAAIGLIERQLKDLAAQAQKTAGAVSEVTEPKTAPKAGDTKAAADRKDAAKPATAQATEEVAATLAKPIPLTFDVAAGAAAAGREIVAAIQSALAGAAFSVPVAAVITPVAAGGTSGGSLADEVAKQAAKTGTRPTS